MKALAAPAARIKLQAHVQAKELAGLNRDGVKFKLRIQAHDRFGNVYTTGCEKPKVYLLGTGATLGSADARGGDRCRVAASPGSPGSPTKRGRAAASARLWEPTSRRVAAAGVATADDARHTLEIAARSPHFNLGDGGGALPDEWQRIVNEIDLMRETLKIDKSGFTPSAANSARGNMTEGGPAAQRDPSMMITATRAIRRDQPASDLGEQPAKTVAAALHVVRGDRRRSHGAARGLGHADSRGDVQAHRCSSLPRVPSAADPAGGSKSFSSGASVRVTIAQARCRSPPTTLCNRLSSRRDGGRDGCRASAGGAR